jgi:thiamine-monophosphate kinase
MIPPTDTHILTVAELGERALIARITARLPLAPWVLVGPGDDAAVVEPEPRMAEALTTDAFVEGVHFDRRFCPPDAIGHKALAVNLSDLAAMGASPRAALLSLILPDDFPVSDLDAMLDGMLALAARHRVAVVGGNIARSPAPGQGLGRAPLVVDVTATGSVARRRVLTRAGARPGDDVYVTGTIGAGAVGLHAFLEAMGGRPLTGLVGESIEWADAQARYLRPQPRVRAGLMLSRNRAASACVDLSDGLADGVRQLAAASGVGLVVDATALPIDETAGRWYAAREIDALDAVLAGGDDYELLFTSRRSQRGRLREARRAMGGLPITRIGAVTRDRGIVLHTAAGPREFPSGFEHFR